jgi:5-oxopent-3-ene-1,2,5-tricarboxylate decarboxylase/2-hydroxyhepta-2,4-diene-1,7-dioate isomerase
MAPCTARCSIHKANWDRPGAQMDQPPYKAPPKAPVLYVKTANTWSAHGATIPVPAHVPEVEVGAPSPW